MLTRCTLLIIYLILDNNFQSEVVYGDNNTKDNHDHQHSMRKQWKFTRNNFTKHFVIIAEENKRTCTCVIILQKILHKKYG